MTITQWRRMGCPVTAAVGAPLVLFGVLPTVLLPPSEPRVQWVMDPEWAWLNRLALIMTMLKPLALVSLSLVQVKHFGRLGFAGFVLTFRGSMLFSRVQFGEALLWSISASWASSLVDPTGPKFAVMGFSTIYLFMGWLYVLSLVLFGIATIQGGVFPRAAAVLPAGGVPWFAGMTFLPPLVRSPGALLAGTGLIWLGNILGGE